MVANGETRWACASMLFVVVCSNVAMAAKADSLRLHFQNYFSRKGPNVVYSYETDFLCEAQWKWTPAQRYGYESWPTLVELPSKNCSLFICQFCLGKKEDERSRSGFRGFHRTWPCFLMKRSAEPQFTATDSVSFCHKHSARCRAAIAFFASGSTHLCSNVAPSKTTHFHSSSSLV